MKKIYLIAGLWAALISAKAQQISTFEEVELQPDSWYNGADGAGGFHSGKVWFVNNYNFDYNSWSGFSVSNMKDTIKPGYDNQYSTIAGGGADSSENYAVVYFPGELKLELETPVIVEGFYVTNSVYAYRDMKNGSGFTKKFGGADGSDPDFFKLIISGIDAEGIETSPVEFYLADFRFDNQEEDYIVDQWFWFDLTSLGVVTDLNFYMESSDTGDWGMNTPAYFCIDNFTITDPVTLSDRFEAKKQEVRIFPNPIDRSFQIQFAGNSRNIEILDIHGVIIYSQPVAGHVDENVSALSNHPSGIYFVRIETSEGFIFRKIMKY